MYGRACAGSANKDGKYPMPPPSQVLHAVTYAHPCSRDIIRVRINFLTLACRIDQTSLKKTIKLILFFEGIEVCN